MPQPQTVFRFITIRNPRKPKKDELSTGFAWYDEKIGAPLVAQVASEQAQGQDHVRGLILTFIRGNGFIRTTAELDAKFGKLVDAGDWLMTQGGGLTAAALAAYLAAHPVEASVDVQRVLWDNLVAFTFGGGVPEVREGVINALRAINLTRVDPLLLKDDAAVKRLATATVIIPSAAKVPRPPKGEHAPADVPDTGAAEKRKMEEAWAHVRHLEEAHAELSALMADEIAEARALEAPAVPMPRRSTNPACGTTLPLDGAGAPTRRIGLLTAERRKGLGEATQAVLHRLKVRDASGVAQALAKIEAESARVGAAVAKGPRYGRQVVQVGGAFWMTDDHSHTRAKTPAGAQRVDLEYTNFFPHTADFARRDCQIKPLGVADYRRVEQEICCYEPGEVAHIENILKGESKERVTRHLKRTEETFTLSTEEEKVEEKDAQSTDRFELEKQSEKAVQEDIKFDIGVNVQAQYGPVKITADAKFGYAHSTKESDKTASKYAKEVTDRALERVTKKVKEEQIRKVVDEYEETNTHKVEAKDEHTVGLYRWVNKVYKAKVVNYGKRLMFEFMIPEPGAFHLFATIKEDVEATVKIEKPIDPRSPEVTSLGMTGPLTNADLITPSNYLLWGALYGAKLEPPPLPEVTTAKSYNREGMSDGGQFSDSKNDLKVPDGYEANSFSVNWGYHQSGDNWATIIVGRWPRTAANDFEWTHSLNGEDDFVPVTVMGRSTFYAANIEVRCLRRDETLKAWKIKTFDAIIKAYAERQSAYDVAFAEAKARAGVEIRGTNPLRNREIEMMELKKGAIRLLTKCADISSNAMRDADPKDPCSVPEFDCCTALAEGAFVQFFEQAFEWKLITYLFYPYFWGRQCNWKKIYQLDDVDPLFLAFLQAGYAKVQVPVRPGYEAAVMRYLADGVIWNGGSVPGVDSDMYVALENEMKQPVGEIDPEVEPWLITVPTTLTVLQCESGCVDGQGLPCPCKDEEQPTP